MPARDELQFGGQTKRGAILLRVPSSKASVELREKVAETLGSEAAEVKVLQECSAMSIKFLDPEETAAEVEHCIKKHLKLKEGDVATMAVSLYPMDSGYKMVVVRMPTRHARRLDGERVVGFTPNPTKRDHTSATLANARQP